MSIGINPLTGLPQLAATKVISSGGSASNAAGATMKSTLTTKGDIYVATGASLPDRLSVGSDGQIIVADSTTPTGVSWKFKGKEIDVRNYGAVDDAILLTDASMVSASTTLTSPTASFTSADVGKAVIVGLAGASKVNLRTTIATYVNGTTVTLALPNSSGVDVASRPASYGTDNTTAFTNALIAARAVQTTMYIPSGTYAVTGGILNETTPYPPGFSIRGDGKGQTKILRFYDDGATNLIFLNGQGPTITTMSAPSAAGVTQITVGTTANCSVGMWVYIADSTQLIYGNTTRSQASIVGEMACVQSVDSATQLTFRGMLANSYTTGTSVNPQRMGDGVFIRDIDFVNPTPSCQLNGGSIAYLVAMQNIVIKNCRTIDYDSSGFTLQTCINAKLLNIDFMNTNDDAGVTPYLILLRTGTSHVLIDQCTMYQGRHLVTTTQPIDTVGPQFVVVSNCIARDCSAAPYDMHPGATHFTFLNCTVTNQNPTPEASIRTGALIAGSGMGFQIRGPDCSIINCRVDGASVGISIYNGSDRTFVSGNRLDKCDKGIFINNSNDLVLLNNWIISPRTHGIDSAADGATWAGFITKLYLKGNRVDGNPTSGAYVMSNWQNTFFIDPDNLAPDATLKVVGRSATTVASAATLTLPAYGKTFQITGTTNITAMTISPLDHGRTVQLRFTGALQMSTGAGLSMKSTLATIAGTNLTLTCDGTSWYQIAPPLFLDQGASGSIVAITYGTAPLFAVYNNSADASGQLLIANSQASASLGWNAGISIGFGAGGASSHDTVLSRSAANELTLYGATSSSYSNLTTNLLRRNAGTPEGVVSAPVGATCQDTTNGRIYVKRTGTGNTGWLQMQTAQPSMMDLAPAGAITQTVPRGTFTISNIALLTSGTLLLQAVSLRAGTTATTINFLSRTTALVTGTNQWFGLFDSNRVCLAVTNDDTSTAWGSSSVKSLNLTTPYVVPTDGFYYIGIMVNASTVPTLGGVVNASSQPGNIAPILIGTSNTAQTTPFTVGATATALTASTAGFAYAYIT